MAQSLLFRASTSTKITGLIYIYLFAKLSKRTSNASLLGCGKDDEEDKRS